MKLITFYYFSKCVQMVIILKHLKQAGLNLTVVLITDYCQTLKHSHHKIHTTKKTTLSSLWKSSPFLQYTENSIKHIEFLIPILICSLILI